MTTAPGQPTAAETIRPIGELFLATATAMWATTFSIDLALFNEFLFPRLGDPPLNVAVLADHYRLASSLARMPAERAQTLAAVNSRWLLRGFPAGGAFHAKSYLAVTPSRATLLIGSGNLTADGLDSGREVFTTFHVGDPVGDAAIATWGSWMRRLIGQVGDDVLAERFQDLERRIPALPRLTSAAQPPLLHNLDTPIAGQLIAAVSAVTDRVDELWLSAPFYDADTAAVGFLLDQLAPRRVNLLVSSTTSVNGERLAERLAASGAEATAAWHQPDQFVHAKLIGLSADRRAWLLSGSANLSRAALTLTPADHGNVELAVLAPMTAEEMRAAFLPPETALGQLDLGSLASLSYRADPEPHLPAVRLLAATALADGRVEITAQPSSGDGWLLDDLTSRQPLMPASNRRMVTASQLPGRLVQLVAADGQILSNRVVVDNPAVLAATLATSLPRTDAGRPPELQPGDLDTPVAQALLWLHRNLVMDVSEQDRLGAPGVSTDETRDQASDELWDRLERERLARDPRAGTYERMWRLRAVRGTEPIIELLEALRARVPADPSNHERSLLARLLVDGNNSGPDAASGRRWKAATRIRVRARNVFRRWAAAQADPRLAWVNPLAPAGNFVMITCALAHLRLDQSRHPDQVELTEDDLDDLWQRWLRGFAGTGQGDGWLDSLDEAELTLARDRLPDWLPEAVAALSWLIIRPGRDHRERVIGFQPVLTAALDHNLLDPTHGTARYLSAILGHAIALGQIEGEFLSALDYIDDELWCARTATELGLDQLTLQAPPGAAQIQVRLDVRGITDPLRDPRLPRLIAAVRHYRRCNGVAVFAQAPGWRLTFVIGEPAAYRSGPGADFIESEVTLASETAEHLAAVGGVLADLFPTGQETAA